MSEEISRSLAKKKAMARDQRGLCFYCQLRLHDDLTWEHLVPRSHRGTNKASNMRICHGQCNTYVGCLPVTLKLKLHDIGVAFGSDAFFQTCAKITSLAPGTLALVAIRRRPRRMTERDYNDLPDEIRRAFEDSERIAIEQQDMQGGLDALYDHEGQNDNYPMRPLVSWA